MKSVLFTSFVSVVIMLFSACNQLPTNEEKRISLMELYGWSTTQSANMEGCLLIDPDKDEARKSGTTARLLIDPNKKGKPLHEAIP